MATNSQCPVCTGPLHFAAGSGKLECEYRGSRNKGKFCPECGAKKPEPKPANGWKCSCGETVTGKFCPECGSPQDCNKY